MMMYPRRTNDFQVNVPYAFYIIDVDPSLPRLVNSTDSTLTVQWRDPKNTTVSYYTVSINDTKTTNLKLVFNRLV